MPCTLRLVGGHEVAVTASAAGFFEAVQTPRRPDVQRFIPLATVVGTRVWISHRHVTAFRDAPDVDPD
jgi:hypothetical protein